MDEQGSSEGELSARWTDFEVAGVALLETSHLELHEGFDTAWLHEGDCPKGSRSQRPGRVGAGILNGTLVGSLNPFPFCTVDSACCATGNSSLVYVLALRFVKCLC